MFDGVFHQGLEAEERQRDREHFGGDLEGDGETVAEAGPYQRPEIPRIVDQVNGGAVLPRLYPMNAETRERYATSKAKK